jgi:hypothetical protein
MAYSLELAERVRLELTKSHGAGVEEKKMFGGVGFLLRGNMACGVNGEELIVRVGPDDHAAALARPQVRPFDMTGKSMAGWIMVGPAGVASDPDLRDWIAWGVAFALSLPKK